MTVRSSDGTSTMHNENQMREKKVECSGIVAISNEVLGFIRSEHDSYHTKERHKSITVDITVFI